MNQPTSNDSQWIALLKELWKRLYLPLSQPSYLLFFAISVVGGAIGIWTAIAEARVSLNPGISVWTSPGVFKSCVTYFAALGALSCIRIIIVEDKLKHLRTFFCLLLVLVVVSTGAAAFFEFHQPGQGYPFVFFCMILAVITWWLANWDPGSFSQVSPDETMGGNLKQQPAGSTNEYRT